jgi:hypothetical protein
MNTTMFHEMSIAPLCIMPFSITDLLYSPNCYKDAIIMTLKTALRLYVKFNLACFVGLVSFVKAVWFPVLCGIILGSIVYGIVKCIELHDTYIPVTPLDVDITQYIHANASTGCTAWMIYEHFRDNYDRNLEFDDVTESLQNLKNRGTLLSVSTTLWIVSGN